MEPLVSIILTLYNGERFVRQAIQSVQAQTWKNWEMIVVDDASSDGSAEAVEAIGDPRISLIRLEKNGQVCNAHRVGDRAAKGEFIAVLDKDDAWEPAKLEKQMAYMAAHPETGACFTRVSFMDEEGRAVSHPFMEQIFTAPNRDREAWVHDLMTKGNCLCHSSALIRKDVLEEIGGYNYLFLQLQDYDLWLRIALLRDLYVIQEPLVRYRRFEDSGSLSQNDADRDRRTFFEYARIVGTTVREMDADLFRRAFAGEMRFRNASSPEEILCEKAILLASDHLVTNCKGEAFALFAELFRSEKGIAVLRDQYGLTQHDVYRMTGKPIQYDRTTEQVGKILVRCLHQFFPVHFGNRTGDALSFLCTVTDHDDVFQKGVVLLQHEHRLRTGYEFFRLHAHHGNFQYAPGCGLQRKAAFRIGECIHVRSLDTDHGGGKRISLRIRNPACRQGLRTHGNRQKGPCQ